MRMFSVIAVVVSALPAMAPGLAAAEDEPEYGKISDSEWSQAAPVDFPEANSVILFERGLLEIALEYVKLTVHQRVKVLTRAGIEEAGEFSFTYDDEYDRIKKFRAQTIAPDGKKYKVEKSSIFDKEVESYKRRTFAFPMVTDGCVLEYEYEIVSDRHFYLKPWYFQNRLYTLKSTCSVSLPNGFVYNVKYHNIPLHLQTPIEVQKPDLSRVAVGELDGTRGVATIKTFTWELTNLPPLEDEPYMMAVDNYRSNLQFHLVAYESPYAKYDYIKPWNEIGKETEKYLQDYLDGGDEIQRIALEKTDTLASPGVKSRVLFDHVARTYKTSTDYVESKYFANEKLSQLLSTGVGTGEEKNLLLVQLHRAVGLEAYPIYICTRDHLLLDPSYADMRQFNYIIAYVQFDKGYKFLDASLPYVAYGTLPPNCRVNGGFLVDGANSDLVSVVLPDVESRRIDRSWIHVGADGHASCSTFCDMTGYWATESAATYEAEEPAEFVKLHLLDPIGGRVTAGDPAGVYDSAGRFTLRVAFESDDITQLLDDNILVNLFAFEFSDNPFKSSQRFFAVDFNYPFEYQNIIEIVPESAPAGFLLPRDTAMDIGGLLMQRTSRSGAETATITWKLSVSEPVIIPQYYGGLRALFDLLALADDEEATILAAAR